MFIKVRNAIIRSLAGPVIDQVILPILDQRIEVANVSRRKQEEGSSRHWYWTGAIHELTAFKRMLEDG